jgi:hypothetical protein
MRIACGFWPLVVWMLGACGAPGTGADEDEGTADGRDTDDADRGGREDVAPDTLPEAEVVEDGGSWTDGLSDVVPDGALDGFVARDCDPFTASGCDAGQACVLLPSRVEPGMIVWTMGCQRAGTSGPGDVCVYEPCEIGSLCMESAWGASMECRQMCRVGGTPDCSEIPGTSCRGIDVGEIGFCETS